MAYPDFIKKLVVARLATMPPNVKFSIGSHGTYTKDQLIQEVRNQTATGAAFVKMDLEYIKQMPHITDVLTEGT